VTPESCGVIVTYDIILIPTSKIKEKVKVKEKYKQKIESTIFNSDTNIFDNYNGKLSDQQCTKI